MRKVLLTVLTAAALTLVLTGCMFQSPESLYQLPKLPEEYSNLQTKLSALLNTGLTYTYPVSGKNTQSIQLHDLDEDGVEEAVAFFRSTSVTDEKPLKIYILKQNSEEEYETAWVIESEGNAIQWILFDQVNDEEDSEVIVGWQLATSVYSVSVYSIESPAAIELMSSSYSSCLVQDIDLDGKREVMLVQLTDEEHESSYVELYQGDGTEVNLDGIAPLSIDMAPSKTTPPTVKYGYLQGGIPAVFINGPYGTAENMRIADIFAIQDGVFTNITLDPDSGNSESTIHSYSLGVQDINDDGITELPMRRALQVGVDESQTQADLQYVVDWYQYDIQGRATFMVTTYHNDKDGWYLELPESWEGCVTITRKDTTYGERIITFGYWNESTEVSTPFLNIYTITGDNREARAQMGDRVVLLSADSTIYAAEFVECDWDCGLTMDDLSLERFHLITTDWNATDG